MGTIKLDTSSLEMVLKSSTLGALALTVLGFLVVTLYDGKYGFTCGTPFRPRMIEAGFIFLLFCAMPIACAYLGIGYGRHPEVTGMRCIPIRCSGFLIFTTTIAFSTNLFLPESEAWMPHVLNPVITVGIIAMIPTVIYIINRKDRWLPYTAAAGVATQLAYLTYHFLKTHYSRGAMALVGWVYLTGTVSFMWAMIGEVSGLNSKESLGTVATTYLSITNFTLPLFVSVLFSHSVYPHISQKWGGGSPVPVVLTFSKDSALPNQKLQRFLIDETDSALYVIDAPSGQAHYVPKSSIWLIDYSPEPFGSR